MRRCRAAGAHHGEAGEQSRGSAGGFELGAAQVELAPGQRLHRVLVEAHHLGVTLADPVRVSDGGRWRRPWGLPVPAPAAAPAAAAEGKLRAAAARGRGGLRMHEARCKGAGRPGRQRRQRPPLPAAPPPPPEASRRLLLARARPDATGRGGTAGGRGGSFAAPLAKARGGRDASLRARQRPGSPGRDPRRAPRLAVAPG